MPLDQRDRDVAIVFAVSDFDVDAVTTVPSSGIRRTVCEQVARSLHRRRTGRARPNGPCGILAG
ncbi:hypothetical protein BJF84_27705 [Rhodococcus sp. CUA-806]|nr:hypothetical protein BJF84_27705 [Rhodococcus sp. CUA-806]